MFSGRWISGWWGEGNSHQCRNWHEARVVCSRPTTPTAARRSECLQRIYHTLLKRLATFPSPAGMSLTKLSLGGNTHFVTGQEEFG